MGEQAENVKGFGRITPASPYSKVVPIRSASGETRIKTA